MKELEAKLAELEGKVNGFLGKLESSLGGTKGDIQSVDQGPLAALDTVLAKVESLRGTLIGKLADVEAKAASMRPD